ncbi:MAG: CoA transferase [Alphaproteobacteria bacterium]|nr:CoA transferase [Alphaproteobacteria bacterium]
MIEGIRIVDLTTVVLGPYCTQILADLGADVVKIEGPDGDSTRYIGSAKNAGMCSIYLNLNRNKRSLALDLKRPESRDLVLKLAAGADVFMHSMRPRAIERLGLDEKAVRAVNSRLVYCVATGYGAAGRYGGRPAYDDVIQAMSGIAALQGKGGDPDYCVTVLADKVTGLCAVYGVLAALLRRARTGEGGSVEVPMFEAAASFVLAEHIGGHAFDPPIGPATYARVTTEYRRPYRTRDGFISVIVYTERQWRSFLGLIGRPELMQDKRVASFEARTRNIDFLYKTIEDALAGRHTADWLADFAELDVPAMPVLTTEDLFDEPHLDDAGFFERQRHPTEGKLRLPRQPVRFDGAQRPDSRPAPRLGRDSVAVLREAGIAEGEIRRLVEQGVVIDGSPIDAPGIDAHAQLG